MCSNLALPPGSRVLVTGANGYLASHVVDQLLQQNYAVRGTVRAAKPWLDEYFTKQYGQGKYESMIVSSFEDINSVERALDGVDGVVHLASDLSFGTDAHATIPWVVKAMLDILEAAAKKPQIKRVVLCSSSSTTYSLYPDPNGRTIDENSWNYEAVQKAWDEHTPENEKGVAVYAASKTEAERQAHKWIEQHKPQFQFNTVLPCFIVGKILHPEIFGSTMGWTLRLLQGDPTAFFKFPEQWFVDVEDAARLCVISLLNPTVNSERIFAFSEQQTWADVVDTFRELSPENKQIPDAPQQARDRTEVKPRTRAEELLRASRHDGFTSVRASLEKALK